jgi:choline-phosphate cytidylyltransferase
VYLLVGVNSDELVQQHKFKCVMEHSERCEAIRHCRWVDEVVPDAPWVLDTAFLEKDNIDYVAHDDEPYLSVGHDDVYAFIKSKGLSALRSYVFEIFTCLQVNSYQRVGRRGSQQAYFLNA